MQVLPLACHPSTPCPWVSTVGVRVDVLDRRRIVFYYEVEGDIDALQLPPQRRSAPGHELWRHTCFEAFLRTPDARSYVELNFSPSSEWAVYGFDAYREGMRTIDLEPPPRIICRRRADRLEADVEVLLTIPELQGDLRIAVAAVLEDTRGRLCYWALAHPSGRPDFHHADGFVLALGSPEGAAASGVSQ